MKKVDFYFDFLSPFSFLAWKWVYANLDSKDHIIDLKPVCMIPIIKDHNERGPAEIPVKRDYLYRFCSRYAVKNNIEFHSPAKLPFNSMMALRLALVGLKEGRGAELIDKLFDLAWSKGGDLEDEAAVISYLNDSGLDGTNLMAKVGEKEFRKELKQNNKDAKELELFGVPSFVVDSQLFWGLESIPDLELYIAGKDPLSQKSYDDFLRKTSSIQ